MTHSGSNGKNLAAIWVQPSRDAAMVVMTNIAGAKADAALLALASELYGRYIAVDAKALPTAPPEPTRAAPAVERNTATPTRRPPAGFSGDVRRGLGK